MAKQNNGKGNSSDKGNSGTRTGQQSTTIKGRETPTPRPPQTSGDKK